MAVSASLTSSSPLPPLENDFSTASALKLGAFPAANGLSSEKQHSSFRNGGPAGLQQQSLRKPEQRPDTIFAGLRNWLVQHQVGISLNLITLLLLTHFCFPRARQYTRPFFYLSYYEPSTGRYLQGSNDAYFVTFWVIVLTGLRVAVMDYLFYPLANCVGIEKPKAKTRFAEQGWLLVYSTASWSLGMYIMRGSPYWFNLSEMWTDFPTRAIDGVMKWYYLVELGFWLQQILVVNIEEHRKDYSIMLTHHFITTTLILTSYCFYQTKVGNVILCAMDSADIFLPLAKLLRYAGHTTICDITFGIFIIVWIITRHVFYTMICWSLWVDTDKINYNGCYSSVTGQRISNDGGREILSNVLQSVLDPEGPTCFNDSIKYGYLGVLSFLHCLTLTWLTFILRVVYRIVVKGENADDNRSDASDDDEDVANLADLEDVEKPQVTEPVSAPIERMSSLSPPPIEQTVGVEGLNLRRRTGSPRFRKSGSSTGSLADKKELLGRIGCEKPID